MQEKANATLEIFRSDVTVVALLRTAHFFPRSLPELGRRAALVHEAGAQVATSYDGHTGLIRAMAVDPSGRCARGAQQGPGQIGFRWES